MSETAATDEIMAPLAGAMTEVDLVSSPIGHVFDGPSLTGQFTEVPEPSSLMLSGLALFALVSFVRTPHKTAGGGREAVGDAAIGERVDLRDGQA